MVDNLAANRGFVCATTVRETKMCGGGKTSKS